MCIIFFPIVLILILVSLFAPMVGIPIILIIAYICRKKKRCPQCGSTNLERKYTIDEEKAMEDEKESRCKEVEAEKARRMKELEERNFLISELRNCSDGSKNIKIKIIGGTGWESMEDNSFDLKITKEAFLVFDLKKIKKLPIPYSDIRGFDIGGPGKVTSGPGIGGGGFGVQGALTGMAIATVANTLLTHSRITTIVKLLTDDSELVFVTSDVEPETMRLLLSPLYVNLSKKATAQEKSIAEKVAELKGLLDSGALDEEQYQKAVNKVVS
jgi:hypothetical protein